MIKIKIYPEIYGDHYSQIYAGLYALAKQNIISFEIIEKKPSFFDNSFVLCIFLEDKSIGLEKVLCFDMHDSYKINSEKKLNICNFYFKRSYCEEYIFSLDKEKIAKIKPYGLNYYCRAIEETDIIKRLLISNRERSVGGDFKKLILGNIKESIMHLLLKSGIRLLHLKPVTDEDILVEPSVPAEPVVFFQTRLWTSQDCPNLTQKNLDEINLMRVETVRALKLNFEDRFLGGLYSSEYALRHCPELVTKIDTKRTSYLDVMKKCLICVTTKGLHDSIGWRFAEFFVASRCIVTEPMRYKLPVPLVDGENYLSFKTPDECVVACEKLLNDPDLVRRMRQANYNYYKNHLESSKLIYNCIAQAI